MPGRASHSDLNDPGTGITPRQQRWGPRDTVPTQRGSSPRSRALSPVPGTSRPAEPGPACEVESTGSPKHARLQSRLLGDGSPALPQARVPGAAEKGGPAGGGAGQDLPDGSGPAPPPTRTQLEQEPEAAGEKEKMPSRAGRTQEPALSPALPRPARANTRPPQLPLVSASTSHAPDRSRWGHGAPGQVPSAAQDLPLLLPEEEAARDSVTPDVASDIDWEVEEKFGERIENRGKATFSGGGSLCPREPSQLDGSKLALIFLYPSF
ncbi:uncharacterized protein LOC112128562 [Pongo abelii]|uniref:uncharacterized protein LOC112128562 n=1 Tax=Pongo abelii TaxID=9601 RepID=UPI0030056D06